MRILLLCLAALALAGCGGSIPLIDGADPCERPVRLPERWLNDQEIELYWSKDREALRDCGAKVETLSGRAPE